MQKARRLLVALYVTLRIFASYALSGLFSRVPGLGQALAHRQSTLHERNARRLLRAILSLQGVYVKLGQVLSILGGFLPYAFRKELESLQDAVPPRPLAELLPRIEASLGRTPEQCFARIEERALAAASLGQVHVAYLHDGRKVAVKILYPGIRELIRLDLAVLRVALALYQRFLPVGNLEVVHASLVDLLRRETDYLHEAECMRRFAKNFEGEEQIACPEVIDALTSSDVLTMSFMDGVKITHRAQLEQRGIEPPAVARLLLESFFAQLFSHRFFHADPHPGNFLVRGMPDAPSRPQLVVLDFGAISEAKTALVEGMIDVLVAYFARDRATLLLAFERMGFVSKSADRAQLEETVLMYFERLLSVRDRTPKALMRKSKDELRALLDPNLELSRLRELSRSFNYPEGWFYIERALVMTFFLCGEIDPEIDMLDVAFPYVMPRLAARSGPDAS